MKPVDQRDFGAGLFFLAFGLLAALAAGQYRLGSFGRMGPGFFPFAAGVGLATVGGLMMAAACRPGARASAIGAWSIRHIVVLLAAVVLFGVLLEPFGLLVAAPVLLGVSSIVHPEASWRGLAISVLVLLPVTWIIFIELLGLPFPLLPRLFEP